MYVEQLLKEAFGREVYFSWVDDDELIVVDTPEEWEDIVMELSEDWLEGNEWKGMMSVKLVEAADADKTVTGKGREKRQGIVSAADAILRHTDGKTASPSAEDETESKAEAQAKAAAEKAVAEARAKEQEKALDLLEVLREGRLSSLNLHDKPTTTTDSDRDQTKALEKSESEHRQEPSAAEHAADPATRELEERLKKLEAEAVEAERAHRERIERLGTEFTCLCPHTAILRVLILPCVSSYYYICALILLCVCPHTTMCVSSYYYVCVLILRFICPHTYRCARKSSGQDSVLSAASKACQQLVGTLYFC